MKEYRIVGVISGILLLVSGMLPVGRINSEIITIFPFFDNLKLGVGMWLWRDISAFAVSFGLLSLLLIGFTVKKWELGSLVTGILILVVALFILFALFLVQLKTLKFDDVEFSFGFAWILIAAGIGMIIYENTKELRIKKGR